MERFHPKLYGRLGSSYPNPRSSCSYVRVRAASSCSDANRQQHWSTQEVVTSARLKQLLADDRNGAVLPATSEASYAALIRFCGNSGMLRQGRDLHSLIARREGGLHRTAFLSNLLIQMYGKCGGAAGLQDARAVFDSNRPNRDIFSWNLMIAAYARNAQNREALELYRSMVLSGFRPDKCTFLPVLSAVACLGEVEEGKRIHEQILCSGGGGGSYGLSDIALMTALLNMYSRCGCLKEARSVFDGISCPDIVAWDAILFAYVHNGHYKEALNLYPCMILQGIKPDKGIFACLLTACSALPSLESGRTIHEHITALQLDSEPTLKIGLLNMYGKCGSAHDARAIFDSMHGEQDTVAWSAMLAAYAQNGHGEDAFRLFHQMRLHGIKPDKITFLSFLTVRNCFTSVEDLRTIHRSIITFGFDSDTAIKTALLNSYASCGSLLDARAIFNSMQHKDAISWNSMLTAYAQKGHVNEALDICRRMESNKIKPEKGILLCLLNACADLPSLESGRDVHNRVISNGFEAEASIKTALINMYGKCGSMEDAWSVLDDGMLEWDVISWSAMVAAYTHNGLGNDALKLFQHMYIQRGGGGEPDEVTFLCILNACSHAGLWEEGWHYFVTMHHSCSNVIPKQEHYECMIDILGRTGCLSEAEDMLRNMPVRAKVVAWKSLLGACQIHADAE